MEQLVHHKQLRIRKDFLLLSLEEKKQIKTKSRLYLAIFVVLFIGMVTLDPNPNSSEMANSSPEAAANILKFVAGKFLVASVYFGYRGYLTGKQIKTLEKDLQEMNKELRHLSN
jgi:hypothetical protein